MATPTETASEATQRVFGHHLGAFSDGIDAILSDYTEQSVLLTPDATYRGLQQIRDFFDAFLKAASPEFWSAFKLGTHVIEGEVAYMTWSAGSFMPLATDTLLVRGGRIQVQTFTPFRS
ncbi:nuclear transport factor 2 family protein [Azospirillum sp. RWY-5-1]|uniref:Nuclear transport factor 2 family protein n=1 Tax=Azospirillum oleiclasticum TaxID=2735135 RepID=A0ABX2T4B2_9PROT|nr:nuclear transport factor 2 family protein [Azospirillum oleiclasticum]NYZ11995.1 nuclear transport factor 2 family protein [Azospirillum oleiclasticum]NYZ19155.1 nuclear transport factor 2 family protein [Azospirillum oleiclasticum]